MKLLQLAGVWRPGSVLPSELPQWHSGRSLGVYGGSLPLQTAHYL